MTTATDRPSLDVEELLAEADRLVAAGRALEAIELLRPHAGHGSAAVEIRLVEVRHAAFAEIEPSGFPSWPVPVDGVDTSGTPELPEIEPSEMTADVVRRHILSRGCVIVRGLFREHAAAFAESIDRALAVREAQGYRGKEAGNPSLFQALKLPPEKAKSLGRHWVAGAGGLLTCDSPLLLHRLFETYEAVGLKKLLTDYLGERPVLSANKCTLRKVPTTANTDWHQDGAFIGQGIRALNVWIALTDCGVDAPGMDLVPKRFDHIVETGTGGAIFDWAVGPDTVAKVAADAPPVRPRFEVGDAVLFDDLCLHRTAIDASMTNDRFAIESWFFAPTDYPSTQVPIVW